MHTHTHTSKPAKKAKKNNNKKKNAKKHKKTTTRITTHQAQLVNGKYGTNKLVTYIVNFFLAVNQ